MPKKPTLALEFLPLVDVTPYERNARLHSAEQLRQIASSMLEFGWTNPALHDAGELVAGHGRCEAAALIYSEGGSILLPDGTPIPEGHGLFLNCAGWTEEQRRAYVLADNRLAENATWDEDLLALELKFLDGADFDTGLLGFTPEELEQALTGIKPHSVSNNALSEKFGVPPFTVLDARQGWWQDRKRSWLGLGIQSDLGREGLKGTTNQMDGKVDYMTGRGPTGGGSIFDPVVAELAYRWFCPLSGTVLDPFAGGSVRGVVAAKLGRAYVGIDLRAEQVAANIVQAGELCVEGEPMPEWIEGDSRDVATLAPDLSADFLFSCPPYADLEVYSDDPRDLSNMDYSEFIEAYRQVIAQSAHRLKADRFACFVVGEVRDSKGMYYGFVPDTIRAFEAAGLRFYNEAVLLTPLGSVPVRAGRHFEQGRKMGKAHQNVLVFVKGDPKKATAAIGPVEFGEINESATPEGDA